MALLTQTQADALQALDWLLSQAEADRATGRSYVLALAYLRHAERHRERWIQVEALGEDLRQSDVYLAAQVERIANAIQLMDFWRRDSRIFLSRHAGPPEALAWLWSIQVAPPNSVIGDLGDTASQFRNQASVPTTAPIHELSRTPWLVDRRRDAVLTHSSVPLVSSLSPVAPEPPWRTLWDRLQDPEEED